MLRLVIPDPLPGPQPDDREPHERLHNRNIVRWSVGWRSPDDREPHERLHNRNIVRRSPVGGLAVAGWRSPVAGR
jgi:hypothetical protein